MIEISHVGKWYGPTPGAEGLHHRGRQGRGGRGVRPVGLGQVDADQMRQRRWSRSRRARSSSTASRSAIPRPICRNCAPASAWCSSISNCSRTCRSCAIWRCRRIKVLGRSAEEADEKGMRLLDRVGLHVHADKYPGRAVRRPAAARRHRARAGDGPDRHAVRRADLGARSGNDPGGARRHGRRSPRRA